MSDINLKVEFLEARLTLLERRFTELTATSALMDVSPPRSTSIVCNDPGLLVNRIYSLEHDESGQPFCWIGNNGPVQFLIPVASGFTVSCRLILQPHKAVDFSRLSIFANDRPYPYKVDTTTQSGKMIIEFHVPISGAPYLNVQLLDVSSVRPCEVGDGDDERLLMARFRDMEISYS